MTPVIASSQLPPAGESCFGIASLSPRWPQRHALCHQSPQIRPLDRRRRAHLAATILDPLSITPASASPAQAAASSNSHRRQPPNRPPAGSFLGGFRTSALSTCGSVTTGRHPKPFTFSVTQLRIRNGSSCPDSAIDADLQLGSVGGERLHSCRSAYAARFRLSSILAACACADPGDSIRGEQGGADGRCPTAHRSRSERGAPPSARSSERPMSVRSGPISIISTVATGHRISGPSRSTTPTAGLPARTSRRAGAASGFSARCRFGRTCGTAGWHSRSSPR